MMLTPAMLLRTTAAVAATCSPQSVPKGPQPALPVLPPAAIKRLSCHMTMGGFLHQSRFSTLDFELADVTYRMTEPLQAAEAQPIEAQ